MTQKLVVGPVNRGLKLDREPFFIDNDNFPTLLNAYQWRGKVKRKRGTSPLTRLEVYLFSVEFPNGFEVGPIGTLDGSGNLAATNLITLFTLGSSATIAPGSISFTDGVNTFKEPAIPNGTLIGTPAGSGTINYATGVITITGGVPGAVLIGTFGYYPDLPVMGLKEINITAQQFPGTIAFDTKFAYNILTAFPYPNYNINYYANPPANAINLPGYLPKPDATAFTWNGKDYQQFITHNYENAFWATNGIPVPFQTTNIGMQFKLITNVVIVTTGPFPANPPASATLTIANHGLVDGDFIFVNEVVGNTAANMGINFQTGYVTTVVNNNTVIVTFPYATLSGTYVSGGIAQYLTNTANPLLDPIRWYDGDPTNGQPLNLLVNSGLGWVNFSPPLSQLPYPIADLPPLQYYLVGCKTFYPYKDRLIFFGAVIQASTGAPIYLQDTIVYSQNGTPYYTASFTGNPALANVVYQPTLAPPNQTATASAWFEDITGYGGYLEVGLAQPITSVAPNRDVLIVGFTNKQTKLQYTGVDLTPFIFFIINSEMGTSAPFSTITFDESVYSIGEHGIIQANQSKAERIDLDIPDNVFDFRLTKNGSQRIAAQRDFISEWVYFTYCSSESTTSLFPDQSLLYNYRDQSWAQFIESYTAYGQFRKQSGFTWATVGFVYPTWNAWTDPWNAGESTLLQTEIIGGNQQGFVIVKDDGTGEAPSLFIQSITGSGGTITVTSPNHNLNSGDFIYITNALGMGGVNSLEGDAITGITKANPAVVTANNTFETGEMVIISGVAGMTQVNGNTYTVITATPTSVTINVDSTGFTAYMSGGTISLQPAFIIWQVTVTGVNTFTAVTNLPVTPKGSYAGLGVITRLYVPFIQTKQFQMGWGMGRKSRIGPQMYLFSTTTNAQIELQIYLSQNAATAFNNPPIVPASGASNNALVYTDILFTCQESANLGLTAPNINLQQVVPAQAQTWHRMNTSLIGDSVQVGFTLNDDQMFDPTLSNQVSEIELHGFVMDVTPSQMLV